jgi:hypothetical protein
MLSLSRILEKIVPRLLHPHSFKIGVNEVLREQVMNGYTEILGGGDSIRETLIKIQVGVIKAVEDLDFDAIVQIGQVADHSGNRIHLAPHRDFHHVIVAMAVRIAALPVDLTVLLLTVGLGVEPMGSAQRVPSRKVGPHGSP